MSSYTPIRVRTIHPGKEISFDLYIHFKDQYVVYAQNGKSLEKELIKKLKKQKMAKFFITDVHEEAYQTYLDEVLLTAASDDSLDVTEKVDLVSSGTSNALDDFNKDPGSEESYNKTKNAAKSFSQVVLENPEALKSVLGGHEDNDFLVQHSLNVCGLSVRLATELKLSSESIESISMASLLHDVGLANLGKKGKELFTKGREELGEDKKTYLEHTTNVTSVLKDRPYINQNILTLIEHHEETVGGDGPMKKMKLTPEEEVLSLCNSFDKYLVTKNLSPKEAYKEFQVDYMGKYELDAINALKKVLETGGMY